jgi:hypothetical protein
MFDILPVAISAFKRKFFKFKTSTQTSRPVRWMEGIEIERFIERFIEIYLRESRGTGYAWKGIGELSPYDIRI